MNLSCSPLRIAPALGFALALVAVGGVFALQKPGRTNVRSGSDTKDTLLLKGSSGNPAIFASADTRGLGWATRTSPCIACGRCVS